jgi:hypothetical protein
VDRHWFRMDAKFTGTERMESSVFGCEHKAMMDARRVTSLQEASSERRTALSELQTSNTRNALRQSFTALCRS